MSRVFERPHLQVNLVSMLRSKRRGMRREAELTSFTSLLTTIPMTQRLHDSFDSPTVSDSTTSLSISGVTSQRLYVAITSSLNGL